MSTHAKLSPSSSSRWLNCPGSVGACEDFPDETNVYADEGTFAHEIAERALRRIAREDVAPAIALDDLRGEVSECERFTADDAMLEHLEEYVDFCGAIIRGGTNFWIESRVHAIRNKVYGTADFVAVIGKTLVVSDLKYGAGIPVSPTGNTQARIYALGALDHLKRTDTKLFDKVDTVDIIIHQPRNRAGGGTDRLTRAELEAWHEETLVPGVAATEGDPDDPLTEPAREAGDWCRFCDAKGSCYRLKDTALAASKDVFADTETLEVVEKPADPRELTVDQVGKALDAVPVIEAWIKALHAHATTLSNGGTTVPGYKRVRKVGRRAWTDEKRAEAMLKEQVEDGAEIYAPRKLLSPAQAEKALDVIGKALVDKLTSKPDAGTALVPLSDKRAAFSPGDVFTSEKSEKKN